jgi:response regulator of citrate/malate metabolism
MWVNVSTNTMMKALANGVCDYWIKSLDANQIKCCKETFEWKWKTNKLMETYLEVEDKEKKGKEII